MGNTSNSNFRVHTDSSTNKYESAGPKMWSTAQSLRPNIEKLALACMDGDEEAIAIRDAWQFHTSTAIRLVQVSREEFTRMTEQQCSPFVLAGKDEFSFADLAIVEDEEAEKLSEDTVLPSEKKAVVSEDWSGGAFTWQEKESAIGDLLDDEYLAYKGDHDAEFNQL